MVQKMIFLSHWLFCYLFPAMYKIPTSFPVPKAQFAVPPARAVRRVADMSPLVMNPLGWGVGGLTIQHESDFQTRLFRLPFPNRAQVWVFHCIFLYGSVVSILNFQKVVCFFSEPFGGSPAKLSDFQGTIFSKASV